MNKLGSAGAPGSGSFLFADPVTEHDALVEAGHASERRALTAVKEYQDDEYGHNGSNGSSNGHNGNGSNGSSNGHNGQH
jgi:ubiquinol-cytochrome c reductase cytochrome b subunit